MKKCGTNSCSARWNLRTISIRLKVPWIKAYFDVGNVAISGYPQDWIRVLGKRIVKLHIKDFKFEKNVASWMP